MKRLLGVNFWLRILGVGLAFLGGFAFVASDLLSRWPTVDLRDLFAVVGSVVYGIVLIEMAPAGTEARQ